MRYIERLNKDVNNEIYWKAKQRVEGILIFISMLTVLRIKISY